MNNMNKTAYFGIFLFLSLLFFILRDWLTYNDEKEHCECYFQFKSTFLSGILVSVLLEFLQNSTLIPNMNHYHGS